jgi:ATP-dependent Lon protease
LSFTASQPGRIIGGLARIGSSTPVVLLDEIDKLGADRSRTPGNALLEVLDPEQNAHFQDNYLSVSFDLSHVLFIATANDVSKIDPILRDRLEVVEIDGYTLAEKLRITREHLLAKLADEHGLGEPLAIDDDTLGHVVESYTAEAGVRQLHQTLAAFHRNRAVAIAKGSPPEIALRAIERDEVRPVLGPPRFLIETAQAELGPGVATALSVGPAGGEILFVEVGTTPGRGELHVTGSVGTVMQESAEAALAYIRIHAQRYGLPEDALARDVHVHVPAGATQKDGPSAGIALAAAMLSALSGVPLKAGVAMTGELTLSGRLLPVGGVRAKLLAAERAGTTRVIVPDKNRADVPEGLDVEVIFAATVDAALSIVCGPPNVAAAASGASPAAPA